MLALLCYVCTVYWLPHLLTFYVFLHIFTYFTVFMVAYVNLILKKMMLMMMMMMTVWAGVFIAWLSAIAVYCNDLIWKVVFANKSRKLGWIWMKLGRWGCGLKRLSLARLQWNRAMSFGEIAKKWVAEVLFFLSRVRRATSATFLGSISAKLSMKRVQVVAHNTWFHIPEKFLLSGRISGKTVFFRVQKGILFVLRLRVTGNVLRCRNSLHPLVDIPQIFPSWVTFAEGCTVFQLSTSEVILSHSIGTNQNNILARAVHSTL